ncbi:MAG: hypothetical protein H6737_13195 [Alphaproteobacteria bacterium]|nr:hypothetical protein [Alphaproteobacteria bacterium]
MKAVMLNLGRWLVLTIAHAVLFTVGAQLFPPVADMALDPADEAVAGVALLAMSAVDAALVLAVVRTSRLHGLPLMGLVAGLLWFVKTVISQMEAAYFMPNVTGLMLPALLAMTLPLSLGLGPLAVWVGGRARRSDLDESPGLAPVGLPARQLWLRVGLLSAGVYPFLFFTAGWFIAFRSAALREFYGGARGDTFFAHYAWVFAHDPLLYPLEVLRGALWVAAAVLLLRSTRGPWWIGTLHVALWFSLVENDGLLVPNPLMAPEIRLYHFIETASSNFVFAWCIGALLGRVDGNTRPAS